MSATTGARRWLHWPPEPANHVSPPTTAPPEARPSRDEQKARALGVTSATGLVIGSIIGTGVFTMPAVLAGAGTVYRNRPVDRG
jgi:hypothetical protein